MIGHKRLIFTIDKAEKTAMRKAIRKIVIDFFKNMLGFKDDDIILIDRTEFGKLFGLPKFSAKTKEAMKIKRFARSIFEDNHYGLAKQILNFAICEC